jgi:DNA-binding transcriptional LysR family regulator
VDLRQLRYLVAVADEGGIRRASRRLHLSQPSLSQALRQLEAELGVTLVVRSAQGVELTDAGSELVDHAREILDREAAARRAMRRRAEQRSCTLRVGLLAGIIAAGELTAPILEHFHQARPDVDVRLSDIGFFDMATPLMSGEVDVALIRAPLTHREIHLTPLALDPRLVLVGSTHELAGVGRVDVEDILEERTIPVVAPEDFAAFWHGDDYRGGSNTDPTMAPAKTVADLQFAVATGRAIMIAASVTARVLPNDLLRPVEVTGLSPNVIAAARLRTDHRQVVRDFIDAAAETAATQIDLLPGGSPVA